MAHLLHIDASPRGVRSHSRQLSRDFVEAWKQAYPAGRVTYRDVGRNPVPHVDELWIAAAYTPPEQHTPSLRQAISLSDQLVDELLAADLIVVGVPMYNFSIPSGLKAYIDHIVRPGRTFAFIPDDAANPYKPLVLGKKMVIITARGGAGFGAGEPNAAANFQDPYLRTIFGFIGITDMTVIPIENVEAGGASLAQSLAAARELISQRVGGLM